MPCFGRGDPEYKELEDDVLGRLLTMSGHKKIVRMQGSGSLALEIVATNFLESMLENNFATRGEVNDIYSTLSQGAKGLVLAAETAIGKNPIECVNVIKKIYKIFKKNKNKFSF